MKKKKIITILVVILVLFSLHVIKSKPRKGENMFDQSNFKTEKTKDRIVAAFTPESGAAFQYCSPTIVDDYIYIGTSTNIDASTEPEEYLSSLPDNYFYKMNLDLNVIWEYPLEKGNVHGSASLDSQGNIYFVTNSYYAGENDYMGKNHLLSLTNDGKFRWKKQISYEDESWKHAMMNPAIDVNDIIYLGDSKLYAFYTNGSIKWQYPDNDSKITGMRSSPVIDSKGDIYFISPKPYTNNDDYEKYNVRVYKFKPEGTLIWSTKLDNNILFDEGGIENGGGGGRGSTAYSSPAFLKDKKSFYTIVGNTINRVDSETGEIIWSMTPINATGRFKATPAVDENNTLYVGTKSNFESNLYSIDSDGNLIWMQHVGADLYSSPVLGDNGVLYIGSEGTKVGRFHAIDMGTGELQWSSFRNYPDFSYGSPTLKDGYIYFGVHEVLGYQYFWSYRDALLKIKVEANNYQENAAWPRMHGGNMNLGRKLDKITAEREKPTKPKETDVPLDEEEEPDVEKFEELLNETKKSIENPKQTLSNFGFNLDYYNPKTKYVGDFYFTSGKVPGDRIFTPTGHVTDEGKFLPYPGYHLPVGTEIISPIDGVVTAVEKNEGVEDYEVHMSQNGVKDYIIAFDHLVNVKVEVEDVVVVGQKLGEVPPYGENDVGMTELEFFKGGNPPIAYCPFDFLEEELKEEYSAMLYDLVEKWEDFKGDDSLFNEEDWVSPGCLVKSTAD